MPLWVVLMRTGIGRERPRRLTWVGTVVGLGGIAVLARPGTQGDVELWGVLLVLFATICWAFGVFITPRLTLPDDNFVGAVYEMVGGGVVLLVAAAVVGEFDDFSVAAVPAEGWWAFVYLTLIGSVVAFSAFVWLLGHAPPSLVTTLRVRQPGGRGVPRVGDPVRARDAPRRRSVAHSQCSASRSSCAANVRGQASEPEEVAQHG